MSEVVVFDAVEQILARLDVIDLIRCKSVCKSWRSLISSNRFTKANLNHTYNNTSGGHTRILIPEGSKISDTRFFAYNGCHIVGSSNGLVSFSPAGAQLSVTNPSTRELKTLPDPQGRSNQRRGIIFFGFGYDSSTDDFKVILGCYVGEQRSCFQVLTLKSNTWKIIGDVNYGFVSTISGILCNGAIHWFMNDQAGNKKVILSFDLSSEEFKEIPQPDDTLYECNVDHRLGVFEEYLCIYNYRSLSSNKWVMKKYNVQESWELLPYDCKMRYRLLDAYDESPFYLKTTGDYIGGPIFVPSLVSPNINNTVDVETLVSPPVNNNGRPAKKETN